MVQFFGTRNFAFPSLLSRWTVQWYIVKSFPWNVCPFIFTHNLLMEIAATSLSKGGKYEDIFSVLTGGVLSHLSSIVSVLHLVPMQVQHLRFSLSSIASWRRASSFSCFFIPNLDFLKGKEKHESWGSPAMHNLKLTLVEPRYSAALSYLSSGFAIWHLAWECYIRQLLAEVEHGQSELSKGCVQGSEPIP